MLNVAAGVAAGFNAPISGVFFAVETVLQKRNRAPSYNSGQVLLPSMQLVCIQREMRLIINHICVRAQASCLPS